MHYTTTLLMLFSAISTIIAAPLPLNINLGAYSPALVVGDGEISFGGEETAAATLATLAGTSGTTTLAEGLTRAGTTPPSTSTIPTFTPIPTPSPKKEKRDLDTLFEMRDLETAVRREGLDIEEREVEEKRDLAGFTAALNFAAGSLLNSPTVELGTGEGGSGVGITVTPKGVTK